MDAIMDFFKKTFDPEKYQDWLPPLIFGFILCLMIMSLLKGTSVKGTSFRSILRRRKKSRGRAWIHALTSPHVVPMELDRTSFPEIRLYVDRPEDLSEEETGRCN